MSLADAEMRHRHQRAQPMSMDTDRKRTIEARLDKLTKRVQETFPNSNVEVRMLGILRGTLDLLRDVLLEDEPR